MILPPQVLEGGPSRPPRAAIVATVPPSERTPDGRVRAVDEAVRVLQPEGRLALVAIRAADEYAAKLTDLGPLEVTGRLLGILVRRSLVAASSVTATRPT